MNWSAWTVLPPKLKRSRFSRFLRRIGFETKYRVSSWMRLKSSQFPAAQRAPIAEVREVFFFAAVYLYVAGWSYEYFYLREFGIHLAWLNLDHYNFLICSYSVISSPLGAVAFTVGLVSSGICNYMLHSRFGSAPVLCAMIPISFGIGRHIGIRTALLMRSLDDGQRISFVFKVKDCCLPDLSGRRC
jgi:hypothetical protein